MRGTVAKQLRRFVKEDTPDLEPVVYTSVVTGQPFKRKDFNETVVLGECQRSYYKLLKYLHYKDKL